MVHVGRHRPPAFAPAALRLASRSAADALHLHPQALTGWVRTPTISH